MTRFIYKKLNKEILNNILLTKVTIHLLYAKYCGKRKKQGGCLVPEYSLPGTGSLVFSVPATFIRVTAHLQRSLWLGHRSMP